MSALHPVNERTAQIAMLCQFAETFGQPAQQNRALRLHILSLRLRTPVITTNDLTASDCRELAGWLRHLRENDPDRRDAILRRAAQELAPDPAQVNAAPRCVSEATDNRGRALAALEDIGESDHFNRWRAGDAGNILLAESPEARPREVLAEYLKLPETQKLKTFLCPKLAYSDKLPAEVLLKLQSSTVETWAKVCRVASRVPPALREEYALLSWTWFETAATARQPRDGRMVQPTLADIERRLEVAADNEYHFRSPQDLKRWIAAGEVMMERPKADAPDLTDEALAAFRAAFYSCDSVAMGWDSVFGDNGEYRIVRARRQAS